MQTKHTKPARKRRQRKCKCCHRMFTPQPHNAFRNKGREHEIQHQLYCTSKFCQKASSRRSNLRFRKTNPDYHLKKKDKARVRMQKYRAAHRGHKARGHHRFQVATLWVLFTAGQLRFLLRLEDKRSGVLQDFCITQPVVVARVAARFESMLQGFFRVSRECWYFWHRFSQDLPQSAAAKGGKGKKRCQMQTQPEMPGTASRTQQCPGRQSKTPGSSKKSRGSTTKPSAMRRRHESG